MAGRMLFGPAINAAMQKANQPDVKYSKLSYCNRMAPINNIEVKNIKAAGCTGLTQFQRKLLQHLDDM